MSTLDKPHFDLEAGVAATDTTSLNGGASSTRASNADHRCCSSDEELHAPPPGQPGDEIVCVKEKKRSSSVSECSVVVDLETEGVDTSDKLHLVTVERDCRICHLGLDASNLESGVPIELGCSCKDDLAAVHKHCAEAWFKIKGNKTCEICGSIAQNIAGANDTEPEEQWNETNEAANAPAPTETRNFWQGHRFLNFLLACVVFAFVISWLFHFNVPS